MMDEMGVYAQICFHNSGVTQTGSLMSLGDPELALAIIRMYNDAARNRQQESGDRLFTLAHLPIWDKAAMEAEARRCVDIGLKGFVLPDTPERVGVPSFVHDYRSEEHTSELTSLLRISYAVFCLPKKT